MSAGPEIRYDPLALADTHISLPSPEHLNRLEQKLQEYRQRPEFDTGLDPAEPITPENFTRYNLCFKYLTLGIVVNRAGDPRRSTLSHPITMDEVAVAFQRLTGLDVSGALSPPFVYDPAADWYKPDVAQIVREAGLHAGLFASAYEIVRAYAWNRPDAVTGGTGLPGQSQPHTT